MGDLFDLIHSGGLVMWPLLLSTIVLWYSLTYRMIVLKRGSQLSLKEIFHLEILGKTFFIQSIEKMKEAKTEDELKIISNEIDIECSKYNTLINTLIMIAPLLGLLGTVGGMIETFEGLGSMSMHTQSGGIARGISQALVSTQMGLLVAIPALIFNKNLKRKEVKLRNELEQFRQLVRIHHA